jgi:hypothetical protein
MSALLAALLLQATITTSYPLSLIPGMADGLGCTGSQVVRRNAGDTAFECFTLAAGSGDVVGPASATDNTVALYDGTTGKLIKAGSLISDDATRVTLATASVFASSVATDGTRPFFGLTGTFPNSASAAIYGARFQVTGPGTSGAQPQHAVQINFTNGGSFSHTRTIALEVINLNAVFGGDLNLGVASTMPSGAGIYARAQIGDASAAIYGDAGTCSTSDTCVGVLGKFVGNANNDNGFGGLFYASGSTDAGEDIALAAIMSGAESDSQGIATALTNDTALLVDNGTHSADLVTVRDNGSIVFQVQDGGNLRIADSALDHRYTITRSDLAADRNLALPLLTGDDTFAVLGLAQTYSARKTFGAGITLSSGQVIEGTEAAAPGTPAAGQVILYAKSGTPGEWCSKDDAGTETCMSGGSTPTGTGFRHVTSGAEDAASVLVNLTNAAHVAANQGTTTQVLHGNAAGQASWATISLTTDMGDSLSCTGDQVVRRNAGDTAFECATISGGSGLSHPQVMARASLGAFR